MLELKKKNEVRQPVVSTKESQNHEGNEVNLKIRPRVDEHEEEETTKEEEKGVQLEEETEGSVVEEHGEEEEGFEYIVEQADEGDFLIAERALIGFQRVEKKPKEESLASNENTMIPIPLPYLKISQTNPSQNSVELSHSPTSNKPIFKSSSQ